LIPISTTQITETRTGETGSVSLLISWSGRSSGEFNTGVIFVPGAATGHGYDPRRIVGVRRLMEIN
jgi:hypothetical protein